MRQLTCTSCTKTIRIKVRAMLDLPVGWDKPRRVKLTRERWRSPSMRHDYVEWDTLTYACACASYRPGRGGYPSGWPPELMKL